LGETLDAQGWLGSGLILLAVIVGALASDANADAERSRVSAAV
jgi:hypothetical protein